VYINTPPLKCSKCGSTFCETFSRRYVEGIRCLVCEHEVTKVKPEYQEHDQHSWTYESRPYQEF